MARDKIQFEPNTPVLAVLEFPEGKKSEGRYGDEMYYSLAENGCMYVPLEVDTMIQDLRPKRGAAIWIEKKWSGNRKDKPKWEVWPDQGEETPLEADLRRSIEQRQAPGSRPSAPVGAAEPPSQRLPQHPTTGNGNNNGHQNGNGSQPARGSQPAAPVTRLEDALKTVALALFRAEIFAKEIGYEAWPKQFTPEDVRTMANTLVIQERERR